MSKRKKKKHLQQNQTPDSSGYQSDIEWSLTPEEHSELRKQCQIFMEMMPKFTLSGGLWQLGANIATSLGFNVKQPTYWMMTGLGDGIGVGTGNAITHMIKLCFDQEEQALWRKSPSDYIKKVLVESYGLYGIPSLLSGSLWQPMVNAVLDATETNFKQQLCGGAIIGIACGSVFFVSLVAMRILLSRFKDNHDEHFIEKYNKRVLIDDLLISIWNVTGAAAAFTMTSFNSSPFLTTGKSYIDCGKAAFATLGGYIATRLPETLMRGAEGHCESESSYAVIP